MTPTLSRPSLRSGPRPKPLAQTKNKSDATAIDDRAFKAVVEGLCWLFKERPYAFKAVAKLAIDMVDDEYAHDPRDRNPALARRLRKVIDAWEPDPDQE